ncbi:GNAT family N-acetyltransferase [Longirhabdus pacifica]|uniref:GNAT family N-acetyltransferase n=1 Tax=Longirhabdus pacifica TaxID=2305227 RepID=UPI0035207F9C
MRCRAMEKTLGTGRSLMLQGLLYLKKNGLHEAQLHVLTNNKSALSLYESVGFAISKEEQRYRIHL